MKFTEFSITLMLLNLSSFVRSLITTSGWTLKYCEIKQISDFIFYPLELRTNPIIGIGAGKKLSTSISRGHPKAAVTTFLWHEKYYSNLD